MVIEEDSKEVRYFSRNLMCPTSGISYPNPEPNNFSFNSPKGACPDCSGIGTLYKVNAAKIIPDTSLSIKNGGLAPQGNQTDSWIFKQLELIAQRYKFNLTDPIGNTLYMTTTRRQGYLGRRRVEYASVFSTTRTIKNIITKYKKNNLIILYKG
jgi:excinuclease UvrABC ATPase subunit